MLGLILSVWTGVLGDTEPATSYTPALDFSDAQNSQYAALI